MRVAAFTKYDRQAASTRQRLLQYLPRLASAGIEVDYHPLLSNDYVRSLATGEQPSRLQIARAYLRRFRHLLELGGYDLIWIYAELFPYLPAAFEKLAFATGTPIVYDFDDAMFLPYDQHPSAWVRRLLAGKLEPLISGAAACCCGNLYLRDYARRFNGNSMILPTVVDTDAYRPVPGRGDGRVTVGWIGSPSSWPNVRTILPVLASLHRRHGIRFRAIGAGAAAERDRFEGMELADWSEASEIEEVRAMDIGIMPLLDRPFERGKSGYKLIQYMACGVPVVASPVGVNSEIVTPGANGFLATGEREWSDALEELVLDPGLRARMGREGRERAVERYSLSSQAPRLIEIFRSAAKGR